VCPRKRGQFTRIITAVGYLILYSYANSVLVTQESIGCQEVRLCILSCLETFCLLVLLELYDFITQEKGENLTLTDFRILGCGIFYGLLIENRWQDTKAKIKGFLFSSCNDFVMEKKFKA
jgi:hypothetical protein